MTPFRLLFVGVDHPHGAGWREVLPQLREPVEITAIVPRFGGTTAGLEERYSTVPRFETVVEALESATFDGAIVCLPNAETPPTVQQLANAGKHVLVEKPGAGSAADWEPVVEAVRRNRVAFQNGYLWRYDPGIERLREMITAGRFGKLIHIQMGLFTSDVNRRGPGHYLFDPKQSGPGFFNWLGCHWLDVLPFVLPDPVIAVTARVGCLGAVPIPMEDGGTILLETAGGTLITYTGGYWLPRWTGESRWSLFGSQRWVHWEPSVPNTGGVFHIHGPQPQFHAMEETFTLPPDRTPGYGGARAVQLIEEWIAVARGDQPACRNTVDSTLTTLRLLDRVYESSTSGKRIAL